MDENEHQRHSCPEELQLLHWTVAEIAGIGVLTHILAAAVASVQFLLVGIHLAEDAVGLPVLETHCLGVELQSINGGYSKARALLIMTGMLLKSLR